MSPNDTVSLESVDTQFEDPQGGESTRLSRPGKSTAWKLVLGLLATVALIGGIPYAIASKDARHPPIEEHPIQLQLPSGASLESLPLARVVEAIGGDGAKVLLDGREVAIRYDGVIAPERGDKCYREALDRNSSLLGSKVYLLGRLDSADFLTPPTVYAFTEQGVSIDATLVAEGFARASLKGATYEREIVQLQEQAAAAGRGCLWQ